MKRSRLAASLLSALLLPACAGQPKAPAPEGAPVTVATAERKDVPLEIRVIGNVEAEATVTLRARVGGEVTKVFFQEGDEVAAGAPLFRIDPRPYEAALKEAEAVLQRDRVRAQNAAADVERYAELVKKDFVTKEQYDLAVANAGAAKATVSADEAAVETARLNLAYCDIAAPIPGRTGSLLVHAGNVIKANDNPLVVIHKIRPVYVRFAVPERYLDAIREEMGHGAPLPVSAAPPDSSEEPHVGRLLFVDNAVDQATGTLTLKAAFDNADRALWPGQFVNVALTLATEKSATVVPTEALQTGQGGSYVFVVKDDLTVESRPVRVSRTYEHVAVLASGVLPGERVVTDGQLRLAPGSKVEIKS